MALGFGVLRLPPDHLWRMTPRELAAAARGLSGALSPPPPSRADLARLEAHFSSQPNTPGGSHG